MPLLADFGTSWTKLLDTGSGEKRIEKTKDLGSLRADLATGHNTNSRAAHTVNELIALGQGSLQLIDDQDFTVLDVGSRDIKFVRFSGRRVAEMNWSAKCGALTGFTLELILGYFDIDPSKVKPSRRALSITCGVLGLEQLFEAIAAGRDPAEAVAEFTRGLALNAFRLVGKPRRFFLSGGMCENPLFLKSFPPGVEVVPLGRFVLVEGLKKELEIGSSEKKQDQGRGHAFRRA
ncbi:MAG: ATPase [Candidatus Glassbacteria bacterium]|nr:ATPase [Candidatus Glassbacteria bacterium]